MYSLFIDTHSELIKLILYKDGNIINSKEKLSAMQHSVYTMPLVDEILKENNITTNDLEEIIVVNGPGSFTGVRIGVTIAKTMAYLLDIPIKSIDTLKMQAIQFEKDKKIVIEGEKNGKYIGIFDKDNNLIENYKYLKNSEFLEFEKENEISKPVIDYEKVYAYLKTEKPINPHAINPLYIKLIEVQK